MNDTTTTETTTTDTITSAQAETIINRLDQILVDMPLLFEELTKAIHIQFTVLIGVILVFYLMGRRRS